MCNGFSRKISTHINNIIFGGAQCEHRLRLGLGRKFWILKIFQHISIILFLQVPSVNID